MNIRQQIVQSNIEKTAIHLEIEEDAAFTRLAHSLVTDQSLHSFEERELVDGGQDKQIDVISIFDENDEAYVYILQVKNTQSFSSNILVQLRNGLQWVFNKSRADISALSNTNLKDQILSYRALQSSIGPSNIHVKVAYITNAPRKVISNECIEEEKSITDEYDNEVFASFKFEYWSAEEIVDRINALEKKNKKISADIKMRYDANAPSLIKYQTQGLTGIVCSVPATEISRIVNEDVNGYVFDLNIRKYLGNRGSVNPEILSTCSNAETSYLFWFLNNGITIVCDKVDPVTDPDDPHVKLTNMQIVNGCQTASSLARAGTNGELQKDARVIVRIYQTEDIDLVDRIVLTTNNQNKISGRNLRSNDLVQVDIERGFEFYNLYYERKPRQYDSIEGIQKASVISNDIAATSYLAVVLKRCSDARSRKYKVWSEFYDKIFTGDIVQPFVLSSLIYSNVKDSLKHESYVKDSNEKRRYIAKNASFHISRIASFLFRGSDSWIDTNKMDSEISKIQDGMVNFDDFTRKSFDILLNVVSDEKDLNAELKSSHLDSKISKELNIKFR
ncbi:AIPR family protein [Bowmanella denitrificans]|uniref:AIPR family protein n=1 Tax=Bowmanella denitrificans TaxID=366582 RepID=UPI000C9CDB12|nr:AIPR family protein [Bowmanella denitrificans]